MRNVLLKLKLLAVLPVC